jgi:hypothetical protein
MKRFLILFTLFAFSVVSCAGPSKVRWTKPDFRQDQFEKDREDCIQAVKDDPEQKMIVEECLTKKGYAGPNKVGWTKPDFRQDQFEKDRKECIHSIYKYLDSETFGMALDECLKWTKPYFSQDQFEKDREECIHSTYKFLDSETFGKALDECLQKKGYEYQASQDKEPLSKSVKTLQTLGEIVLFPLFLALWVVVFIMTGGRGMM